MVLEQIYQEINTKRQLGMLQGHFFIFGPPMEERSVKRMSAWNFSRVSEGSRKRQQQCRRESPKSNQTYVVFIWVVFLMISENRDFLDSAILLKGVCFRWKWKDGLIIRRKTRKTQLSKVVNEEVKLCGNASQTWFNQPTKQSENALTVNVQENTRSILLT